MRGTRIKYNTEAYTDYRQNIMAIYVGMGDRVTHVKIKRRKRIKPAEWRKKDRVQLQPPLQTQHYANHLCFHTCLIRLSFLSNYSLTSQKHLRKFLYMSFSASIPDTYEKEWNCSSHQSLCYLASQNVRAT